MRLDDERSDRWIHAERYGQLSMERPAIGSGPLDKAGRSDRQVVQRCNVRDLPRRFAGIENVEFGRRCGGGPRICDAAAGRGRKSFDAAVARGKCLRCSGRRSDSVQAYRDAVHQAGNEIGRLPLGTAGAARPEIAIQRCGDVAVTDVQVFARWKKAVPRVRERDSVARRGEERRDRPRIGEECVTDDVVDRAAANVDRHVLRVFEITVQRRRLADGRDARTVRGPRWIVIRNRAAIRPAILRKRAFAFACDVDDVKVTLGRCGVAVVALRRHPVDARGARRRGERRFDGSDATAVGRPREVEYGASPRRQRVQRSAARVGDHDRVGPAFRRAQPGDRRAARRPSWRVQAGRHRRHRSVRERNQAGRFSERIGFRIRGCDVDQCARSVRRDARRRR